MRGRQAADEFKLPPRLSRRNATGEWSPGQQINYGTGKSVNEETVADAGEPLTIRCSNRSYLELPEWRPR